MNDSEAAAAGKKMAEAADYKINTHAQFAGLKRLSARANAGPNNNNIHSSSIPRKVSFSFTTYGRSLIDHLRRNCGVRVGAGLTSDEFEKIEATFQFTFPPDLRGILQEGLPLGVGFPDWRSGGFQKLNMWINMPKLGLCSAVERGEFWWKRWGARPADAEEAVRVARVALRKVPVLIPVYGQCYVPASSPARAGNPVLFVDELNVYYCGLEVSDLFHKESFVAQCCSSRVSGVYVPEPMSVHEVGSGRGNLEGARRLIARCASSVGQEKPMMISDRRKAEQILNEDEDEELGCTGSSEAWGRSLDALGRHSDTTLSSRKSNSSARSVLTGARSSYGSRSSDGSMDDSPRFNASSSEEAASSRPRSRGFRRIEFWSNMIEKGQSMNVAIARASEIELGSNDEFLQLQQEQQQDRHQDCCLEAELKARVNASQAVTESIKDMTSKLRKAGWNEVDIAEIMDAAASSSCSDLHHNNKKQQLPDRQTVLEGLALQLDFLSACLRKAGWSVHDVAETLCFDLEHHRRPRTNVSPEVAARIGILAAFVAQG